MQVISIENNKPADPVVLVIEFLFKLIANRKEGRENRILPLS
jgi:hypothetical protein